jgi:hypothetical protein
MNDSFDIDLEKLAKRHANKFSEQPETPDLLPSISCDLDALEHIIIPDEPESERVNGQRANMSVQLDLLRRSHRGRSELALYHALSIAYLRRNTKHTEKSMVLFRRFWTEKSSTLAVCLDTRWLISALQTFYDHGQSAGEKAAGGVGFMYGNMIKVYETEFAAITDNVDIQHGKFKNRSFPTMYGFKPGDDILININVLAFDAAVNGGLAKVPLLELLKRSKNANTLFQRIDSLKNSEKYGDHPTYTLSFDGRVKSRSK